MDINEFVQNRKIGIQALTGSHNYNLNTPSSDKYYKFFVFPTFDDLYNNKRFHNSVVSDTLDATAHDIRDLPEQLWKSNINFIEILFTKEKNTLGDFEFLFKDRELYATMQLYTFWKASYGMHLMKMKNLHKGTGNTAHLVEKFGYDTKQACHALRVLYVTSRFMKTGSMEKSLYFEDNDEERDSLLNIKSGFGGEELFLSVVERWHERWKWYCEEFYSKQLPNLEAREKLEKSIKKIVEKRITP